MNFVCMILMGCFAVSLARAVDLVLGHFEYQIDYELTPSDPDAGWSSSISYDLDGSFADNDGVVRLAVDGVRLLAAPSTREVVTNPQPLFGVTNEPLWILSQTNVPGELFLGWRAIYERGLFQVKVGNNYSPSPLGSISASLLQVEGTGPERGGHFAMWTRGGFGSFEFHYDTTDGINGDDELSPIPAGSHSHYNWGFTKPGTYQVRFRNEGRLNPQFGNQLTQSEAEISFVVPHDGFLKGEAKWRLGSGDAGVEPVSIYDEGMRVDYASDQIALVAHEGQFRMKPIGTGDEVLGRVGIVDPEAIAFPGDDAVTVSLLNELGPGEVTQGQQGGDVIFNFSAAGIYRLTLGARQGEVRGRPFVLTFLVDLPVDYSYQQWAGSFERTHGLVGGALAEPTADFDHDGVSNGLEFLLFWHGVDPVMSDCGLLPRPRFVDGRAEVTFLRDLHKDDFAGTPLELAAAFSPDLQGPWQPWRRLFSEGNAGGFYEDGDERGNETSAVMRRKLVVPGASENFGFFRFEQRSRN